VELVGWTSLALEISAARRWRIVFLWVGCWPSALLPVAKLYVLFALEAAPSPMPEKATKKVTIEANFILVVRQK